MTAGRVESDEGRVEQAPDVIDTLCYANWESLEEYFEYLTDSWRDYFGGGQTSQGLDLRPTDPVPGRLIPNPLGEHVKGLSFSDHLTDNGIVRALVRHDRAFSLPAVATPRVSLELTRAANNWLVDFVDRDDRLFAAILAPTQVPEAGADEIRRLADNGRVAAVALSVNSLAKPFGHPVYRPLLQAAVDAGLPVVIATDAEAVVDSLAYPTAGGLPSTYTDFASLSSQSLQTHLVSMIGQGVFEDLPELRVVFAGAGIAWVPPIIFRFDANFKGLHRSAPWLKRRPSEYVLNNMRFCTWPLERPKTPEQLEAFLRPLDGFADVVCYGSGYPRWGAETATTVREFLPEQWHSHVLRATAADSFRWPRIARREPA